MLNSFDTGIQILFFFDQSKECVSLQTYASKVMIRTKGF